MSWKDTEYVSKAIIEALQATDELLKMEVLPGEDGNCRRSMLWEQRQVLLKALELLAFGVANGRAQFQQVELKEAEPRVKGVGK